MGDDLAANGAFMVVRVTADTRTDGFASSDPTIFEVDSQGIDGTIRTHQPGTADLIVSRRGVEVDRVALTTVLVSKLHVTDGAHREAPPQGPLLFSGFERPLLVSLHDVNDRPLIGTVDLTAEASGSLSAFVPIPGNNSVLSKATATPGPGHITVHFGQAAADYNARVVGPESIDTLGLFTRNLESSTPTGSVVRVTLQGFAGGENVEGAACAWSSVVNATHSAGRSDPDGMFHTNFETPGPEFSATCSVGTARLPLHVVVADVH